MDLGDAAWEQLNTPVYLRVCRDFVNCFIDFPKPLVAVVNGPAVGISVTILGLFLASRRVEEGLSRSFSG